MDTSGYMILGFGVSSSVIFLHVWSFVVRSRNLARDLEYMEKLDKKAPKKTSARKMQKK